MVYKGMIEKLKLNKKGKRKNKNKKTIKKLEKIKK